MRNNTLNIRLNALRRRSPYGVDAIIKSCLKKQKRRMHIRRQTKDVGKIKKRRIYNMIERRRI